MIAPAATLADVAEFHRGVTYKKHQASPEPALGYVPLLRATNIADSLTLETDLVYVPTGLVKDVQRLRIGDIVIATSSGSVSVVGKSASVKAAVEATFGAFCGLLRPNGAIIDPRYLAHFVHVESVRRAWSDAARGTNINNLKAQTVLDTEIPLPPLTEQRRIVEVLEDHLSRLDAAAGYLGNSERRTKSFVKSVLLEAVPEPTEYPSHWRRATVAEAGSVELGRQRHPDWHSGSNMKPYLRVANVFEDRVDVSDLKEMHWPGQTFERFRLRPGDVLLNEGQTPELLGRPAIYRGDPPDVAFTNSLLRFTANPDVLPEFALVVFRRHMHAGRFARESRITTNIAHLSASRLKPIEFPIPPLPVQQEIVDEVARRLGALSALAAATEVLSGRADALRRAVLAAAFAGRLTGTPADDEVLQEIAGV